MAALKDIKRKIGAVKKTQQITKAMNMVAAARLRSSQTKTENFRPYAEKFAKVMQNLASRVEPGIHPFLVKPEEVHRVELIAFSSDRGLCGSFNANIIANVERFIRAKKKEGVEVSLTLVGKKLVDYFKRRDVNIRARYTDMMNAYDYTAAQQLSQAAAELFLGGEADEIYVHFTGFKSMARQEPTLERLLPIAESGEVAEEIDDSLEYVYEPSAGEILVELLPRSLTIQLYRNMLETSTSEHAARMMAMDNATTNCKDMIEKLSMAFNKARQAAITMELIDIVGGVEALGG